MVVVFPNKPIGFPTKTRSFWGLQLRSRRGRDLGRSALADLAVEIREASLGDGGDHDVATLLGGGRGKDSLKPWEIRNPMESRLNLGILLFVKVREFLL